MDRIYLDHAATSPMHPDILEVMMPYLTEVFGNASSIHHTGRRARQALDGARAMIATELNVRPQTILFTSGGTESDNIAIQGYAQANQHKGRHIITTQVEHHAVLHTCKQLEQLGFEVTYLPVDETGMISVEDVDAALREDTILVTVMLGNNEVGTIQPISDIGLKLRDHQAVLHTDAVQAAGSIDLSIHQLQVDMLSVSAHKVNGPKGVGFLYIGEDIKVTPPFFGGEQERKRRAGTENIAGIIGLAESFKYACYNQEEKRKQYRTYKERFSAILEHEEIQFQLNGHEDSQLSHILNISFPRVNVESMLVNLDIAGIEASSGSACTAGSIEPSHVLTSMFGEGNERAKTAIRFSFGLGNTESEIERAAQETAKIVKRFQQQQPFIV
ncbi:cysteine desulfurase family protein [Alkalicoccobacillus murimartini]|uniref:cysteine desulfurase n=1 Tax=Alkalicoccobacillus murimartini TaxID=171685 RepID=A0ABT9YC52_9BACI|nr:cysteine desulfurase family protein [Alkalicoccobacillus murimartini]MDQ0205428.1 cysteine desulfurase [Alkalicoccobacillus murimartini]